MRSPGTGGSGPDGLVVIDKPPGWTSHDVVAKARGLLGTRKVGHAGTLDPDATGVLLLGVGRGTRLLRFLQVLPKSYEAEIVLGVETTTLDASGEVTATYDMSGVTVEEVLAAAGFLTGVIEQVPPMVSAVKVGGRRLHELARAGVEVERSPRRVTVHRFEMSPTEEPLVWHAEVDCSSGTYVRTLAADLGARLGGGAHLRALRRRSVGPYDVGAAVSLEGLGPADLLPMSRALVALDPVTVDPATAGKVAVGGVLEPAEIGAEGDGPWAVHAPEGDLLAVYERHRDGRRVKPAVVLVSGPAGTGPIGRRSPDDR